MRKKFKINLKSKHLIVIMTIVALSMILLTLSSQSVAAPVRNAAGYVVVPFQNGINAVGKWLTAQADSLRDVKELAQENAQLKAKVDELTMQNNLLLQSQTELDRLEKLYELSSEYSQYNMVGAEVISKDPGNWYSTFVINKGTRDGLAVDMNVLADGGLVGIITEVGDNWATVRSVIDDTSNVSAMVANTSDHCVVTGNLLKMNEGKIDFTQLTYEEGKVQEGDAIVTSNVSEKFQTGLLIGYISDMQLDSNNLTTSGTIIPSVDFRHLREVLIITDLKQSKEEQE
ncbi:MAG: rod shape-determining protein MreC [Lachnospiraceae bacterium]|nr:rod shape-determining protein MreC [Lachnospiraceae bacterium]